MTEKTCQHCLLAQTGMPTDYVLRSIKIVDGRIVENYSEKTFNLCEILRGCQKWGGTTTVAGYDKCRSRLEFTPIS